MGENTDEVQKLKRAAAAAFDYEGDPRWSEYWSNILIPPHMASRSDVVDHFRRKFYQLYIDPGIVVEPISMSNSSSSTRPSVSPSTSSSSFSAGASTSWAQSAGTSVPRTIPTRWNRQTLIFSIDLWVIVLGLLTTLPLVQKNLAAKAYFLSFMGAACSSFFTLCSQKGVPGAWNLQALELWFTSIIPSKDFVNVIYSLVFLTSKSCLKSALVPVMCHALENVAKFLSSSFHRSVLYRKFLERPCVWVETNSSTLTILSSNAEVGVGFLLIVSLFSWQRNIVATFMYWQLLKLMYHIPATAADHHSVWTNIGRSVQPAIHRYAPFLRTPISIAQRWWFR